MRETRLSPQGIDLSKVRPLSTIERSYIQTFPDSFKFSGTKTNLEQVIGNAVPINLAFFVASAIVNYIKNKNLDQNKLETFQINQQLCLHF
jgi:DNA (cytosine-5)-methyltransferase 1